MLGQPGDLSFCQHQRGVHDGKRLTSEKPNPNLRVMKVPGSVTGGTIGFLSGKSLIVGFSNLTFPLHKGLGLRG